MGIKSLILNILFVFCCNYIMSAKVTSDTVIFSGKKFVEHIVDAGESLNSISNFYSISSEDIKKANDLTKNLYYKQILYIPIYLNFENTVIDSNNYISNEIDTNITNVALFLPYYIAKNDTLEIKDSVKYINKYYSKSESSLSFHLGVELALDSLISLGKKINLFCFDSNQDSLSVSKIIESDTLKHMDLIIGPMYSKLFLLLSQKYGNDSTKILISPLSRENKAKSYSSVFQIALTHLGQAEKLAEYLIEYKKNENIIILHDSKLVNILNRVKYNFKKENLMVSDYDVSDINNIKNICKDTQNILLLSTNKAFVSRVLSSLGSLDVHSTVFAFEALKTYSNLDINNLMNLNVHIINSRGIDLTNHHDTTFVNAFQKKFFADPQKYSKIGYDIIMHFIGDANIYNFRRTKAGCYENRFAPIFHYKDYMLERVF